MTFTRTFLFLIIIVAVSTPFLARGDKSWSPANAISGDQNVQTRSYPTRDILLVLVLLVVPFAAEAQTSKTEREIVAFRTEIRTAVKAKDRAALSRFLADVFTH